MIKKKDGFTLVELAIVLVIIGIIIGAVLKGQTMIQNSKIKRLKSDIDGLVAAVFSYQDRYSYLPGDDPRASAHFAGAPNGDGNGIWNTTEGNNAWRHLRYAKLVPGDPTITTPAANPFGGGYYFRYNGTLGRNYILVDNIPSDVAQALDEKYDDGVFNSGDIRANADYTGGLRDLYWYAF